MIPSRGYIGHFAHAFGAGCQRAMCVMATATMGLSFAASSAHAQTDRVVALVVSVGDDAGRADTVQSQLQAMGAETLRSVDPNNASLRSMMRRFSAEAEDARASFVYLDMPAVTFSDRDYVLPDSAELLAYSDGLERPTDLFTKSIPLRAFARMAAQAEQGGAVVLTVSAPTEGLPIELAQLAAAPVPVPGASSVLVVDAAVSEPVIDIFKALGSVETVDAGRMFGSMAVLDGVSVSSIPTTPILLKSPPIVEAPAPVIPEPEVASAEELDVPETLEELTVLEQSLSRAAKRSIQNALRAKGHYAGLVDGIFGPQTRAAITAFQSDRTDDPTGILTRRQLLDLTASG